MTCSVFCKGYIEYEDLKADSKQARLCVYLHCPHYMLKSLSVASVFVQTVRLQNGELREMVRSVAWLPGCVRASYVRMSNVLWQYRMRV